MTSSFVYTPAIDALIRDVDTITALFTRLMPMSDPVCLNLLRTIWSLQHLRRGVSVLAVPCSTYVVTLDMPTPCTCVPKITDVKLLPQAYKPQVSDVLKRLLALCGTLAQVPDASDNTYEFTYHASLVISLLEPYLEEALVTPSRCPCSFAQHTCSMALLRCSLLPEKCRCLITVDPQDDMLLAYCNPATSANPAQSMYPSDFGFTQETDVFQCFLSDGVVDVTHPCWRCHDQAAG
jgi:hypothetical protein